MNSKNQLSNVKLRRLIEVSTMYYMEGTSQEKIAQRLGISRSGISRLLREARERGIVEITIHGSPQKHSIALNKLRNLYGIQGGYFVPDSINDVVVEKSIAEGAIDYVKKLGGSGLGIGLGTVIGNMSILMDECEPEDSSFAKVCALIGNFSFSNMKYHGNGMVRKYARYLEAEPVLLHSRTLAKSRGELEKIKGTTSYNRVLNIWNELDTMIVNIGNYPAQSDFGQILQLGQELDEKKAAGRILAYYYDEKGQILELKNTYAVQVPLHQIYACKNVVGVCSSNITAKAVKGALNTGLINHIIMRESLLEEIF